MVILDCFKVRSFAIRATNVPDYFKNHWISGIALIFELSAILIIFSLELTSKPKYLYVTPGEDDNPCPEITANIFSLLSFHWMDPLMKLGYSKDLEMDDLWSLKKEETASYNSEIFYTNWNIECNKKNPSFVRALVRTYGLLFASAGIFKFAQDSLALVQPQFLKQLLVFAGTWSTEHPTNPDPISKGVFLSLMMFLAAVAQTICLHQYFHICLVISLRVKSAITTAVYRKSLVLSNDSRQTSTTGEIVNLMTVDAGRIADLCGYLHICWSGPYQVILALVFLYEALGPSIFAGVFIMIVMIPVNLFIADKSKNLNKIQMTCKDDRTKLMDEMLNGIKVIKLYSWESFFLKKVTKVRDAELANLRILI